MPESRHRLLLTAAELGAVAILVAGAALVHARLVHRRRASVPMAA